MRSIAATERAITVRSSCAGTSTLTRGHSRRASAAAGSRGSQRSRYSTAVVIHIRLVTIG
jgi:hypothetical protein